MVGKVAITNPAPIGPHSVECSPAMDIIPTVSVFSFGVLIKVVENINSFQVDKKVKMETVDKAGLSNGRIIL